MAEKKRRPPSGKVKPGTPHPTKAHTVRGFDGRWVTRKSYNAAKKAREVAKKGGSLVKRVSSAVTKTSKGAMTKASKAGELLKIRKGDKGIVRAVKDTYKFGKDTRRSADAVYKAGQVTRKVHDQLVKGGKEFVKGTVESGKAVRRVVNRLKPGGKIVRVSKPKPKFNYDALPKQKGGAIVKSPSGKVVKSPGGKLAKSTSNKGGKLTTTRTPQYKTDAKKTAKQTAQRQKNAARRAKRWDEAQMKKTRAAKGSGPTLGRKPIITKQTSTATKVKRFVSKNAPKVKSAIKSGGKKLSKLAAKTGRVGKFSGRAGYGFDAADSIAKRVKEGANIYRRVKGKPLLTDLKIGPLRLGEATTKFERDRVASQNERLKRTGSFKKSRKPKSKPTATEQNNKGLTFKNMKEKGLLDKAQPIGTYKGGAKAEPIGTAKPGEGKAVPLNKKKKTTTSKTPYWQSPRQKQITEKKAAPKKKKLTMRDRMRAKNVEIHGEKAIKSVEKYNKGWQAARKAGTLKEFKKKNKAKRNWQVGSR